MQLLWRDNSSLVKVLAITTHNKSAKYVLYYSFRPKTNVILGLVKARTISNLTKIVEKSANF
jgi:hypothetical protein